MYVHICFQTDNKGKNDKKCKPQAVSDRHLLCYSGFAANTAIPYRGVTTTRDVKVMETARPCIRVVGTKTVPHIWGKDALVLCGLNLSLSF